MKLFIFDFIISYKPNKTNLVDTLLRRFNYKGENKSINKLLFIL